MRHFITIVSACAGIGACLADAALNPPPSKPGLKASWSEELIYDCRMCEIVLSFFAGAIGAGFVLYRLTGRTHELQTLRSGSLSYLYFLNVMAAVCALGAYVIDWKNGPAVRPSLISAALLIGVTFAFNRLPPENSLTTEEENQLHLEYLGAEEKPAQDDRFRASSHRDPSQPS